MTPKSKYIYAKGKAHVGFNTEFIKTTNLNDKAHKKKAHVHICKYSELYEVWCLCERSPRPRLVKLLIMETAARLRNHTSLKYVIIIDFKVYLWQLITDYYFSQLKA